MNVVILSGHLLAAPTCRELPAADPLWSLDLATHVAGPAAAAVGVSGRRLSVPVVWSSPSVPPSWGAETEVVVAGVVRRRFFRSGGGTQSRTEVVAATVIEVTRRRPPATALARALAALGTDVGATLRSATG